MSRRTSWPASKISDTIDVKMNVYPQHLPPRRQASSVHHCGEGPGCKEFIEQRAPTLLPIESCQFSPIPGSFDASTLHGYKLEAPAAAAALSSELILPLSHASTLKPSPGCHALSQQWPKSQPMWGTTSRPNPSFRRLLKQNTPHSKIHTSLVLFSTGQAAYRVGLRISGEVAVFK